MLIKMLKIALSTYIRVISSLRAAQRSLTKSQIITNILNSNTSEKVTKYKNWLRTCNFLLSSEIPMIFFVPFMEITQPKL